MTWWFRRRPAPPVPCTEVSPDAQAALSRALAALEQAKVDADENAIQIEIIRGERVTNHFGPIIYAGMARGRKTSE